MQLLTFHFDISGIVINDEHSQNKNPISLTFLVFHFDISGYFFNEQHP